MADIVERVLVFELRTGLILANLPHVKANATGAVGQTGNIVATIVLPIINPVSGLPVDWDALTTPNFAGLAYVLTDRDTGATYILNAGPVTSEGYSTDSGSTLTASGALQVLNGVNDWGSLNWDVPQELPAVPDQNEFNSITALADAVVLIKANPETYLPVDVTKYPWGYDIGTVTSSSPARNIGQLVQTISQQGGREFFIGAEFVAVGNLTTIQFFLHAQPWSNPQSVTNLFFDPNCTTLANNFTYGVWTNEPSTGVSIDTTVFHSGTSSAKVTATKWGCALRLMPVQNYTSNSLISTNTVGTRAPSIVLTSSAGVTTGRWALVTEVSQPTNLEYGVISAGSGTGVNLNVEFGSGYVNDGTKTDWNVAIGGIPINEGELYTLSYQGMSDSANTLFSSIIQLYKGDGTQLPNNVFVGSVNQPSANTWTLTSGSFIAPAGARYMVVDLTAYSNTPSAFTGHFDEVMVLEGLGGVDLDTGSVISFFTGDTTDTSDTEYWWSGTINGGPSERLSLASPARFDVTKAFAYDGTPNSTIRTISTTRDLSTTRMRAMELGLTDSTSKTTTAATAADYTAVRPNMVIQYVAPQGSSTGAQFAYGGAWGSTTGRGFNGTGGLSFTSNSTAWGDGLYATASQLQESMSGNIRSTDPYWLPPITTGTFVAQAALVAGNCNGITMQLQLLFYGPGGQQIGSVLTGPSGTFVGNVHATLNLNYTFTMPPGVDSVRIQVVNLSSGGKFVTGSTLTATQQIFSGNVVQYPWGSGSDRTMTAWTYRQYAFDTAGSIPIDYVGQGLQTGSKGALRKVASSDVVVAQSTMAWTLTIDLTQASMNATTDRALPGLVLNPATGKYDIGWDLMSRLKVTVHNHPRITDGEYTAIVQQISHTAGDPFLTVTCAPFTDDISTRGMVSNKTWLTAKLADLTTKISAVTTGANGLS